MRSSGTARSSRASTAVASGALALLAIIWGYNWVVMKVSLRFSEPLTFAVLRTLPGAAALFAALIVLRRPLRPPAIGLTTIVGLLQTTGFVCLSLWALESGGAGKIAVLTFTMPFWLLVIAWLFLGEGLRGSEWCATSMALVGFLLILRPWELRGLTTTLLAVAGGLLWAIGSALVKVIQRRHHDVDVLSLAAWQMILGSPPLLVIALFTSAGSPVWSGAFIWSLVFNIVAVTALGWYLWLFILRAMPAGMAGLSTLAIPVIGAASAWIQLGERPAGAELAGVIIIFAALAVVTARGLDRRRC
ncbi:MAG: EamA family transporter [Actinobacteria bacterium]|nr:EamA family transporter [Actinomycetota bacterium]